jgi:hypothetical protein
MSPTLREVQTEFYKTFQNRIIIKNRCIFDTNEEQGAEE